MKENIRNIFRIVPILFCVALIANEQGTDKNDTQLSLVFDKRYGQIEVGGPYVGAEFHHSRPLPSRISFFFPVANSIDLSKDYWKRDESEPMLLGMGLNGERRIIGKEGWSYRLSPHSVTFSKQKDSIAFSVAYDFCMDEPAMVVSITAKNVSTTTVGLELFVQLNIILRTCQTYAWRDSAWTTYDDKLATVVAHFNDPDTDGASVFVQNVGETPRHWTSNAGDESTSSPVAFWMAGGPLQKKIRSEQKPGPSTAAFAYDRNLKPGGVLSVRLVIGSSRRNEVSERVHRLSSIWKDEINRYDTFVKEKALREVQFVTGDPSLDRTAMWARGILAANAHYLDGAIVPMPCPAEYNFFFTHDLLLTNLGAAYFDGNRLKRDLLYLLSLSKDSILAHAYYWKDDGYKTEYCGPSSWNHLWFVLVSGTYLRHSLDPETGRELEPLLTKSIQQILTQKGPDGLMYGSYPDWWDIGNHRGTRAYLTALTIRALREYTFIQSFLGNRFALAGKLQQTADSMQQAMALLWDDDNKYLMNFNGDVKDPHIYAGSLTAAVYGLLPKDRALELVRSAGRELLDPPIGVKTVSPADFHTDSMKAFFKFAGNEAGDPHVYINGGVWAHTNAWYALALMAVGKSSEAYSFIKNVMTLDGIINSPSGQPAFYEYRNTDSGSANHGKVDKPSFLWAAGMYLNVLYALSGVCRGEWNLAFHGNLPEELKTADYTLLFGTEKQVTLTRRGIHLERFVADGVVVPSLVVPIEIRQSKKWDLLFGRPLTPYLEDVNAMLHSATYDKPSRSLTLTISSLDDHVTRAKVVSQSSPTKALLNGTALPTKSSLTSDGRAVKTIFEFNGSFDRQILEIFF